MFATLKNRDFALLWTGGLISMIGNWVLLAALPFHVYAVTGSALATSGLLAAYIAPGILFGSVAGVFVDRWNRKRTMVVAVLLQALTLGVLVLVNSPDLIWLIYLVVFVESSLAQFFSPAENALLPTLVGKEHLMAANSLNALNDNLARLVGPAIGGAALGLFGFSTVILIDAFSYLLAALLIIWIHAPAAQPTRQVQQTGQGARAAFLGFWREWLAGLRLMVNDRLLRALFIVVGVALFADAILSAILVVFVQEDMGLTAVEFGWMMTARGLGGLIGGLLVAQLASRLHPTRLIAWGLVISGVLIAVVVAMPTLVVAIPVLVLVGIVALAWIVSIQTLMQEGTEDNFRGRVFGAFGTTTTLLMLAGTAISGFLTDQLGATVLVGSAAVFYILAGLIGVVLFAGITIPKLTGVAAD